MQLTVHDAARLLQVPERTVYRWIRAGSIPCFKIGDQHRFHKVELLEWAQRENLTVAPDAFAGERGQGPQQSVADAILAGGVHHTVPGHDVETILREVTARLRLSDEGDRAALLAVFLAREAKATTAIGGGIAIPHVRNPVVLDVKRPQICVCFLREPADLHAPDGLPVHTVFALISPNVRSHLQMLARLSALLNKPGLKALLEKHPPADELVAGVRALEASLGDEGKPAPRGS